LEFPLVDADDLEPGGVVALVPLLEMRKRSDAVDAGVLPEIDDDDLPTKFLHRGRCSADAQPNRILREFRSPIARGQFGERGQHSQEQSGK